MIFTSKLVAVASLLNLRYKFFIAWSILVSILAFSYLWKLWTAWHAL